MARVRVRYFALLRDIFGKSEEILEINGTLSDLISILEKRNPKFKEILTRVRVILIAINGELIEQQLKKSEIILKNNDVIDLMPPPAGG